MTPRAMTDREVSYGGLGGCQWTPPYVVANVRAGVDVGATLPLLTDRGFDEKGHR